MAYLGIYPKRLRFRYSSNVMPVSLLRHDRDQKELSFITTRLTTVGIIFASDRTLTWCSTSTIPKAFEERGGQGQKGACSGGLNLKRFGYITHYFL